jgi:hypothetical protein
MNVVAIRPQPTATRSMRASDRRIARVEVFDDLTVAEPHWRALELVDSLATPYQRYDFLKHWQRHVGSNSGMTPFIVVGFNQGSEPLFLLPLGSRPIGGLIGSNSWVANMRTSTWHCGGAMSPPRRFLARKLAIGIAHWNARRRRDLHPQCSLSGGAGRSRARCTHNYCRHGIEDFPRHTQPATCWCRGKRPPSRRAMPASYGGRH